MNDPFDKLLADKIRQELTGHEVPYQPEDWAAMQQLLKQKQRPFPYWWLLGGLLALLLLLGGGYWLIPSEKDEHPKVSITEREKEKSLGLSDNEQAAVSSGLVEGNVAEKKTSHQEPNDTTSDDGKEKQGSSNTDQDISSAIPLSPSVNAHATDQSGKSSFAKQDEEVIDKFTLHSVKEGEVEDLSVENDVASQGEKLANASTVPLLLEVENEEEKALLAPELNSFPYQSFVLLLSQIQMDSISVVYVPEKSNRPLNVRFSVGLQGGLLINPQTAPQSTYRHGLFGLQFNTHFGENWLLSTGFNLSKQQDDYMAEVPLVAPPIYDSVSIITGVPEFSGSSRVTGFVMKPVHATLNQLEIPLSVQYRFRRGRQLRPFVSVGVVNYIFLKEHYQEGQFGYLANASSSLFLTNDQVNDFRSEAQYPKEYSNLRTEWAGVLGLSFGLEQKISDRVSLGLVSYWRMPLRRLTSEELDIDAGGFNFFLRYGLSR